MPIDLGDFANALGRSLGEIPPIAIALALLAGPTMALIGYRLVSAARRMPASQVVEAAPFWVCQQCRSINELRLSRCYHCATKRDAVGDMEVILDRPVGPPAIFEVPAGSPFAALGANLDPAARPVTAATRPGVPVMADPGSGRVPIPVRGDEAGVADAGVGAEAAAREVTPATERRP
jgi:hypothetical protein